MSRKVKMVWEDTNEELTEKEQKELNTVGWERHYRDALIKYISIFNIGSMKVLVYLLDNRNYEGYILGSVRQIAKNTGVSQKTVSDVFKKLRDRDLLRKQGNGIYMLEPQIAGPGRSISFIQINNSWVGLKEKIDNE